MPYKLFVILISLLLSYSGGIARDWYAESTKEYVLDGAAYKVISEEGKTAVLVYYIGDENCVIPEHITIPTDSGEEIKHIVVEISDEAFTAKITGMAKLDHIYQTDYWASRKYYHSILESVVIPESIAIIGIRAFAASYEVV